MIQLTEKNWLIQFGEASPRKIEFDDDENTFELSDEEGNWKQEGQSLILSGDALPVEELVFEEVDGKYVSPSQPPIVIFPGVDRFDLIRRLRECGLLSVQLLDVEQITNPTERSSAAAKLIRSAVMHDGFFHQGYYYQSSTESLLLIVGRTAQIPSLDFAKVFPIIWRDADNQYRQFDNSDSWFDFYHSLQTHIETCDRNCYELKQAIASGRPFDLSEGWPATRFPVKMLADYLDSAG